jgi:hypothetical protein
MIKHYTPWNKPFYLKNVRFVGIGQNSKNNSLPLDKRQAVIFTKS